MHSPWYRIVPHVLANLGSRALSIISSPRASNRSSSATREPLVLSRNSIFGVCFDALYATFSLQCWFRVGPGDVFIVAFHLNASEFRHSLHCLACRHIMTLLIKAYRYPSTLAVHSAIYCLAFCFHSTIWLLANFPVP
jgi:hypothetical protein